MCDFHKQHNRKLDLELDGKGNRFSFQILEYNRGFKQMHKTWDFALFLQQNRVIFAKLQKQLNPLLDEDINE